MFFYEEYPNKEMDDPHHACICWRLPKPFGKVWSRSNRVARVQPRTSKGITDLLLSSWFWLNTNSSSKKSLNWNRLFSRSRFRSLTELTRQIAPPIESRKAFFPWKLINYECLILRKTRIRLHTSWIIERKMEIFRL